jgi:peptide/nickel transport system substrate-binding protein
MTRIARSLLALALAATLGWGAAQATFTYAAQADAVGLSPVLTNDQVSSVANRHIYENLVRRNPATLELEPWLAASWETPDDNTWVFTLRPGITFHDGTPFDAAAVKHTFDRIKDPATGSPRASLLAPVATIEVVDDLTLRMTTSAPYGAFLAALAHINAAIESPTAVEQYGDLMQNPVGTGPFRFDRWVSGDRIVLAANPDYWGGAPAIDVFEIVVIPDVNTQVALLERGEVDLLDALPPELIARVQTLPRVTMLSQPGTPVFFLGFNHGDPLWQDARARAAVASAVNTEVIVTLLQPTAVASCSVIGPQVFGYVAGVEEACVTTDPAQAAALWADAEGTRPVTLWVPQLGNYPRVGQIVQGQLSQAGIAAEINLVEWGAYLAATSRLEHDLFLLGWSNVTADGSELLFPNLHTANIGASNRSGYSNPAIDAIIAASRGTPDQAERLALLDQANRALLADVAWVTLYHEVLVVAHRDALSGLEQLPNGDWLIGNASISD